MLTHHGRRRQVHLIRRCPRFIVRTKCARISVTRLGKLIHFGKLFKSDCNNYFSKITHILGNFCEGAEIFHFSCEIIFEQLCRHLAIFYWSHWQESQTHRAKNTHHWGKYHHCTSDLL